MNELKVLLVVPTYNEEYIINELIQKIKKSFSKAKIIIIDGYSKDSTIKIVKKNNIDVVQIDKIFGISLAIDTALMKANIDNIDYLIRIDGDGQHLPSDVKQVFDCAIRDNIDLAIGSRFLDASDYKPNTVRRLGIDILSFFIKLLYKKKIMDCTSGCQIISKKLIKKITIDKNFEYSEIGIICKTLQSDCLLKEYFINMQERKGGQSTFNFINSCKYMSINLINIIMSYNFKYK